MVMIVCHHYTVHGGFSSPTINTLGINTIFVQVLGMFGKVACSVFALITGYFYINSSGKKHFRKIFPVLGQMLFYSLLAVGVAWCFGWSGVNTKTFLPKIAVAFVSNWYAVSYVIFFFFIPFINAWLKKMDKKTYAKLLAVALVAWALSKFLDERNVFGEISIFFVMYPTGAFFRLHVQGKVNYKNSLNLILSLASAGLIVGSLLACYFVGWLFKWEWLVSSAGYFKAENGVFGIPFALFTFAYFANVKWHNKFVNLLGGATFGVYLMHDNAILRYVIWQTLSPNYQFLSNPYLHALIKVVAIFAVCTAIDIIRRYSVGKLCSLPFKKLCDIYDEKASKKGALPLDVRAKTFGELTTDELYEILKLRSQVFMIEQGINCLDMDDVDKVATHFYLLENGEMVAYMRAFDKGDGVAKIGRVLTTKRGQGLGKRLVEFAIEHLKKDGFSKVFVSSQKHAQGFYEKLGFVATSDDYLEEGVLHVAMEQPLATRQA